MALPFKDAFIAGATAGTVGDYLRPVTVVNGLQSRVFRACQLASTSLRDRINPLTLLRAISVGGSRIDAPLRRNQNAAAVAAWRAACYAVLWPTAQGKYGCASGHRLLRRVHHDVLDVM